MKWWCNINLGYLCSVYCLSWEAHLETIQMPTVHLKESKSFNARIEREAWKGKFI